MTIEKLHAHVAEKMKLAQALQAEPITAGQAIAIVLSGLEMTVDEPTGKIVPIQRRAEVSDPCPDRWRDSIHVPQSRRFKP